MCRQNQKMGDQGLNLLNAGNASGTSGNASGTADGDATGGWDGPENPAPISQLLAPFCAVRSIREFSDDSADHQADLFSLPTASLQQFLVHLFHSIVDAGRGNGNHNVKKNEAGRVEIASGGDGAGNVPGNATVQAAGNATVKAAGNVAGKAAHILRTPIRMAAWDLDHGHVFANDPKLFGEGGGDKKVSPSINMRLAITIEFG
jgi:hypothetical protein